MKCLKPNITTLDTRRAAPVATERIRGFKLVGIRQRISLRDEYICQMCGRVTAQGEVDHKVPLWLNGTESDFNRQYLCKTCHKEKTAKEAGKRT